jgi:hypothetical protein
MRSKLTIVIAFSMTAAVLTSAAPRSAQAGPNCGPNALRDQIAGFCNKFKPGFWDILGSAIYPLYGLNKAALWASCHATANAGYLVDAMVNECCVVHDACYARGGTEGCKVACDAEMAACNYRQLTPLIFGWDLALHIATAASIGGYGTFTFNGDYTCGAGFPPPALPPPAEPQY